MGADSPDSHRLNGSSAAAGRAPGGASNASGTPGGTLAGAPAHHLGPMLEPLIRQACEDRLSEIRWFRTDWQRGGAATAFAKLAPAATQPSADGPLDVVIKLPIGPTEHRMLSGLASTTAPTPRVAYSGVELGGYDLAWAVMERLPGQPLATHGHKQDFDQLLHAAALFQFHAGAKWDLTEPRNGFDWPKLLEAAREFVKQNHAHREHAWTHGIKHVRRGLNSLLGVWNARTINTWCHGDLHPGNAMHRAQGSPWGDPGTVLLDFDEVHPGHWVEDAVYLERQYWGHPEALGGAKPVSLLAKARRAIHLDTSDDYATLANVRRLLMAAVAPAFMHREGNPKYLDGAEDVMERMLIALKV